MDIALKKLNLGITVWVPVSKNGGGESDSWYVNQDIGYAKIGSTWGVSLRTIDGDYALPESEDIDSWLFNDAPRTLRIAAIEKIPELLEKLSNEAIETTKKLRGKLADAQAVAQAIKDATLDTQRVLLGPRRTNSQRLKDDEVRTAICSTLHSAGHASAATLLSTATWTFDDSGLRIEVASLGKKMLALTVNASAEKIIRNELNRLGYPGLISIFSTTGVPTNKEGQ